MRLALTVTFSFGGLSTFFSGLEGLVGTPNPSLRAAMHLEHCKSLDSAEWFALNAHPKLVFKQMQKLDGNKPRPCTMSIAEW